MGYAMVVEFSHLISTICSVHITRQRHIHPSSCHSTNSIIASFLMLQHDLYVQPHDNTLPPKFEIWALLSLWESISDSVSCGCRPCLWLFLSAELLCPAPVQFVPCQEKAFDVSLRRYHGIKRLPCAFLLRLLDIPWPIALTCWCICCFCCQCAQ